MYPRNIIRLSLFICKYTSFKNLFAKWTSKVTTIFTLYSHCVMHKLKRHLLGEDLGPLSVKELQQLEKQLEYMCSVTGKTAKGSHLFNSLSFILGPN